MIFKNIKEEFEYILWLRERIYKLNFGITRRVKTDSTEDFGLLTRKLKTYRQEFDFVVDELYFLLKPDDIPKQANNLREESRALSIRDSYCEWQEEKIEKEHEETKQRRNNSRCQTQRKFGF